MGALHAALHLLSGVESPRKVSKISIVRMPLDSPSFVPLCVSCEGVCQRDCTSYYGFLLEEADRLSALLEDFFAAEVCKKFADPDCEFFSTTTVKGSSPVAPFSRRR